MKYEMLLGTQEKFIGHKEDAEILLWHDFLGPKAVTFDEAKNMVDRGETPAGSVVIAMRRIIKEPKRWTVEDQKAGVLPEVGCVVMAIGANEVARIAAINNDSVCSVCVVFEDGGFITLHLSGIAPIETPDEKAQREEDEFVEATCRQNEPHSTLYSDGVRAAYRKLKGGE
jgi:hypothetical protein